MQAYKIIILDFDGVLVESNAIKDKAFEHIFAAYPQHVTQILEYHRTVTAIRFEKFKYVYEHILHLPYTTKIENELGSTFSKFCITQVSACPYVPGALEFLKHFYNRLPMYLVTINPQPDLDLILKAKDLERYFTGIYPVTGAKQAAITRILEIEKLLPSDAIFIGDSQGDVKSAQMAGVNFIGRKSQYSLKDVDVIFDDMQEVLNYLKA